MKKQASFLLKQYKKLSGDVKVKTALKLSKTVRDVRKAGLKATGV